MRKLTSGVFAAALALALPMTGNAQEAVQGQDAMQGQEECRATIEPIRAGDERVMATATFDSPFGEVTSIEAPERSNLSLHTEKDGELEGMAAEREYGEQAREMAAENQSVFWLKAENAEPGTYQVTLENEAGKRCTAELTVEEGDPISRDQDVGIDQEQDDTEW